jgi:hypothetical protein
MTDEQSHSPGSGTRSAALRGEDRHSVHVLPVVLGPKNCEAAVGFPWRWVRDCSRALGVPLIGHGKKLGVRADLFVAALERAGMTSTPDGEPEMASDVDAAELVRRALGKKRRTA